MSHRLWILLAALCLASTSRAQRFFNLTSDEVRVDTVMPHFGYAVPLDGNFQDSVYTATILYPEFVDMTATDIANYRRLSDEPLPALPAISQEVVLERKRGALQVGFCPIVYRDGRYRILVSFMLRVDSRAASQSARRAAALTRASAATSRYAAHSVLATGKWAKIRVPATGIYQLTDALIRKAGFTDLAKVKVYGYGGHLQNEVLRAQDLEKYDDLQEVPTCMADGKRLMYARGTVHWDQQTGGQRIRNPYSDYGYYFITQTDEAPAMVDSAAFLAAYYPTPDDFYMLHEVDAHSWYHGGRNLFDSEPIAQGRTKSVVVSSRNTSLATRITAKVSAGTASQAEIVYKGKVLGTLNISLGDYDKGNEAMAVYSVDGFRAGDTVQIRCVSGGPVRLDYVQAEWAQSTPAPSLKGVFAVPEYVYNITNQDRHADPQADMVIIIPTSQKLMAQARRLADYHAAHDALRVSIVPADELYNEFSSGTPDANAYRRYLKMLYDRAETDRDMPRYLLLMGDCVWDNRMVTPECRSLNPDDYLLCFESENSFNEITCYVDDGFFALLDDGEGGNPFSADKLDLAVGRFPVTTEAEAKVMVDKTIGYGTNANAGAWQNTLVFMGDDGDGNIHMRDLNTAADDIATRYPSYQVKKIIWDAYGQESTATGQAYPEVTAAIKQQQAAGALIMDYAGHGRADQISHEGVLKLADFESFDNRNLPLWITASCDIMAFDGVEQTIGETAVLNPNGGAVAFFGTTRTVYSNYNKLINMAYLRSVLSRDAQGQPVTMGEAQRLAKNLMITSRSDLTTNKLQYSLLGDPALPLNLSRKRIVVDSINGEALAAGKKTMLRAGSVTRVAGHIEGAPDFRGVMSAVVSDAKQLITCRMNVSAQTESPFTYYDRTNTLYSGSDSVRAGRFSFSFVVPMDIEYSDEPGMMNIFAVNADRTLLVNGHCGEFTLGGVADTATDSVGPKVYCYLNTPEFQNGGTVNTTPYFVAQLADADGINVAGSGIGHDLQLIVDGDAAKTYTLNDHFQYDFGSYTNGTVRFGLPALEPGKHTLLFRAWDMRNNPSTTRLDFTVVKALAPTLYGVDVSTNPATTATTFIVSHDMIGSRMDVMIDVFDMSGRQLWTHKAMGVTTESAYIVDWDLVGDSGSRLQTGVYLYRVRVAADGSAMSSKTKKLIVISNI